MSKEPMEITQKIEGLKKFPHCVNCGMIGQEIFAFAEGEGGALTKCCHEAVCERHEEYFFGNKEVSVKACCWAMAELQFRLKGIDVTRQKGMYRFQ